MHTKGATGGANTNKFPGKQMKVLWRLKPQMFPLSVHKVEFRSRLFAMASAPSRMYDTKSGPRSCNIWVRMSLPVACTTRH